MCELDGNVFTGEHDFSLGSRLLLNTEGFLFVCACHVRLVVVVCWVGIHAWLGVLCTASKQDFVVGNTVRCINMQLSKINP